MAEPGKRGYAVPIAIVIVVVVVLILVLSMNKKTKKTSPTASPAASPASSVPEDPILASNEDGTYAIINSVEGFSRYRPYKPGNGGRPNTPPKPGHGGKPGRDPVYGILPIKPGKPGYGIVRPVRPRRGRRERFEGDETDSPIARHGIYIHKTENYLEVYAKSAWDVDEPFCGSDVNQCRLVKFDNREDMFWFLSKLYQDIKSLSLDRFNEIFTQNGWSTGTAEIVNNNPLTLKVSEPEMETQTFVVGVDVSLAESYVGMLHTAKLTGRPLPRPVESEDYSMKLDE